MVCQKIEMDKINLGYIHFLEGVWAGGIQGRVIDFLPTQKGRVSINLTQQRRGSLKFYCFLGDGDIF